MKLPELKRRFTKKYAIRVVAGVLTITLLGGGLSAYTVYGEKNRENTVEAADTGNEDAQGGDVQSAKAQGTAEKLTKSSLSITEKEIGKEENVYFMTDASGAVRETIVTDHLVNKDGSAVLEDASDLSNIENVRGDETFTQNGNVLTWQADGKDIYYQGNSSKEAPISQKVTYYLDGKEIAPENLAGKSGKVTIRFDYTNNTSFEEVINGRKEKVCVPFAALTAVMLNDGFSNVEVTNGRLENNGDTNIVIGYALPGLKESLAVEDSDFSGDITIPESFEITADVEDFSLDMVMTVAMNAGSLMSASGMDTDSLDSMINELADASRQLQDGSATLAEGMDTLQGKLGDFSNGMSTLSQGLKEYTKGADTLSLGIGTLQNGVNQLADNVPALTQGVGQLKDGAAAATEGTRTLKEGAGALKSGTGSLETGAAQVSQGANQLAEGTKEFSQGMEELSTGAAQLSQGVDAAVAMVSGMGNSIDEAKAGVVAQFNAKEELQAQGITYENAADKLQELKAMQQQLIDGIAACAAAGDTAQVAAYKQQLSTVNTAIEQLAGGIGSVAGAQQALDGVKGQLADETVAGQMAALKAGAAQVAGGAGQLSASAELLAEKTEELAGGAAQVSGGASQLSAGADQLYGGADSLLNGLNVLDTGLGTLNEKSGILGNGVLQLKDGTLQLSKGAKELVSNNGALNSGAAQLQDGTAAIIDGVGQLDEGAHTLADGLVEFDEAGISKIVNAYNGDIKSLANRLQALIDAGESYQTYTDIADGVNGSVKFIYKMDAI